MTSSGIQETPVNFQKDSRDLESGVAEYVSPTASPTASINSTKEEASNPPDPYLVDWEESDDNPKTWTNGRKWGTVAVLSIIVFLTPLASSMFAPGVPQVMQEFHSSSTLLATFVVAVFVLGFAFGPLFLAPLSEMYGRIPVYNITNVFFVVFTILCAVSQNMGMLVAFRFLAGVAGVAVITCGAGTISDIMPPEKRGAAIALWSLGPLLGPVIGPIAGGFLIEAKGWRWAFWVIAMVSGVVTIVAFIFLRETYAPILLERKAARLRKETGKPYKSKFATERTTAELWTYSITRPMKMLFLSPIVTIMCVYIAIAYGILYVLFTTFTFVFEDQYGFSTSSAGLTFIASGTGSLLGLAFVGNITDKILQRKIAAGKTIRPEDRLPLIVTIPASLCLPSGLFIYGWTAYYKIHWIVPMIGTGITGFGMICILICVQTYLVDAFTIHAASVNAANAVLRSLLGALLPLCGLKLYDAIGLGWGNTLLGFLALALAPVPWLLAFYGERIRTNPKWQRDF